MPLIIKSKLKPICILMVIYLMVIYRSYSRLSRMQITGKHLFMNTAF